MRMQKILLLPPLGIFAAAAFFACASEPGEPPAVPPPAATSAMPLEQGPGAPVTASPAPDASAAPKAKAEPQKAGDEGPPACPEGMVLIEGDYCTQVEQTCLVEWWAPQNKKRVCEQLASPTKCVGKRVKKRYCIDKFAWPNQKGARPEVMNTFYQAQVKCAAIGKRMCTESEWNFACEGPEMKPFPHGYTRDPKKCNGDHEWDGPNMKLVAKRDATELARLWRGVPSGSQPQCVSDFGVHDMPGNNDEVVAGESPKAKYSSVHTGGPWYSGVRNQCRPKVYTHEEGFYYYFLGFRCCAEADGNKSEPRTPKQVRENLSWKSVERLAGFDTEQAKTVLALKKKGQCKCQSGKLAGAELPSRPIWICDTLCGTLVGPGVKDGDDSTRVLHQSRKKIQTKDE
jgi:hypothetical protein